MKKIIKILATFSLIIVALLAIGCENTNDSNASTKRVEHSFSANATSVLLHEGDTFQFIAVCGEETVSFESKDDSVATVSSTGEISAVGVGETYVVAKTAEQEIACFVSVEKKPNYALVLSKPSSIVVVKDTVVEVTATLYCNQKSQNADITWNVTNAQQCTLTHKNSTATFSSANVGEYTLTATCQYGTATVVITVIEV